MNNKNTFCPICNGLKDDRADRCRPCVSLETTDTRKCTQCHQVKNLSEFRIRTRITPKPRSFCKSCEALNSKNLRKRKSPEEAELEQYLKRKWEKDNPEKHKAQKKRRRARLAGVKEDEIDNVLNKLKTHHHCEICGIHFKKAKGRGRESLVLDHDHSTGEFRGLLCSPCNSALGLFKDSTRILYGAIRYLNRDKKLESLPSPEEYG
jgi:hypothetical protein